MKKVLVILGPTATGKTDLALSLAKKFKGELVSCDSRQVYTGLDIGTGKLPGKKVSVKKEKGFWELDGIKVWMYDVVDPQKQYTVAEYIKPANKIIEDILKKGKLPIIVGGTGLYFKALLEGLSNLVIPANKKLRVELEKLSLEELQKKLKSLSPAAWKNFNESDRKNKRRLLRSIELISMNPYMRTKEKYEGLIKKYNVLKIGLTAPRDVLKKRINLRLISRINQGLIKEGERLLKERVTLERMKKLGLEYGMLAKLLIGEINVSQFTEQLSLKIGQYAKRQMTWFKKEKNIYWFDITKPQTYDEVEKLVLSWYHRSDDKTH